jgi:hypothetical protein
MGIDFPKAEARAAQPVRPGVDTGTAARADP